MRAIIKVGNPPHSKIHNPHYRIYAYGVVQAGSEQVVVLFGYTPQVDLDNPSVIKNPNVTLASWKAFYNGKWYGDFVTANDSVEGKGDALLDELFDILFDQADDSLKAVFAQQNV